MCVCSFVCVRVCVLKIETFQQFDVYVYLVLGAGFNQGSFFVGACAARKISLADFRRFGSNPKNAWDFFKSAMENGSKVGQTFRSS